MCHLGPQYSAVTRLGYGTRLSRLYTLDQPPSVALAFSRSSHLATPDHEQKHNQRIPDKSHVPQADPLVIGLHNLNYMHDREKVIDHMRDKYAKRDIKLKHNSMNIIAYGARR
jgi:hypothetical protein